MCIPRDASKGEQEAQKSVGVDHYSLESTTSSLLAAIGVTRTKLVEYCSSAVNFCEILPGGLALSSVVCSLQTLPLSAIDTM